MSVLSSRTGLACVVVASLEGADATLYSIDGANGVMVIPTKKASKP